MEQFKIIAKSELEKLPKTTGVYAFFTKRTVGTSDVPIYIGKAINIQSRVKNHFQQPSYRDNFFIDKVEKVGFFETNNSEIEALILEANLIKKYQPKFNVIWKDDKNYFYVAIAQTLRHSSGQADQKIPYIFITHQPKLYPKPYTLNPIYIGPFVEGTALKKTLRFLRRVFPYYTTTLRHGSGRAIHPKNKCAYCHLDLCPGPNPDIAEYKKNIKKLILILKGKRNVALNVLKKEMREASKNQNFEKAGKLRDKIYNLQRVMSHTRVINNENNINELITKIHDRENSLVTLQELLNIEKILRIECYDVSNIQGKQATGSMVVFINGKPDKSQYRKFKIRLPEKPNDIAMLKEILERRFSHPQWKYPEIILIDGGKAQLNVAIKTKKIYDTSYRRSSISRDANEVRNIRILAIAKKNNELYMEEKNKPVLLKTLPREISNLILQLRDEAHRFAVTYHKTLRRKNLLQ